MGPSKLLKSTLQVYGCWEAELVANNKQTKKKIELLKILTITLFLPSQRKEK
jgi:hypothetical protein